MRPFSALLTGVVLVGCGHVAVVQPAPQGRLQVEGAVGGPMVIVANQALPVPLATAGVRYGLIDKLDVAAHAHLTSLAFGVGGADVGGAYQVLVHQGAVPALTMSSRLYGFASFRGDTLAMVEATATASYGILGDRVRFYLAPTVLQPFAVSPITFSLGAGVLGRISNTEFQLESRWYQPTVDSRPAAANWVSVAGQGAVGVVLGIRHLIGEEK